MSASRIGAIDLVRGAVMILMALDHARVYAGVPAGGPDPGVFFTRWITHFCAPAFLFLAGSSAFLYGRRHGGLSRFLVTRGLWLIVLEFTILRLSWTFTLDFTHGAMAGVIWVIGCCFVLMAPLVKLPAVVVGVIGLVIVGAHNLMDPHLFEWGARAGSDPLGWLWNVVYLGFWGGPIAPGEGGRSLVVLYSVVPWIGVMAAGYGFGAILVMEPVRRDRLCASIGFGAIALFVVLRGSNLYGDPQPWGAPSGAGAGAMPAPLSFLNATKYPASLSFLLMTLGPTLALMPLLDRARGPVARWITVFGRVPFFFYVLHIPLVHALAIAVSWMRLGEVSPWLFALHPLSNPPAPEEYVWGLPLLYLVFAVAVILLYFPCRWFARLKARRNDAWLRYL